VQPLIAESESKRLAGRRSAAGADQSALREMAFLTPFEPEEEADRSLDCFAE
jgi:hypothetical protein